MECATERQLALNLHVASLSEPLSVLLTVFLIAEGAPKIYGDQHGTTLTCETLLFLRSIQTSKPERLTALCQRRLTVNKEIILYPAISIPLIITMHAFLRSLADAVASEDTPEAPSSSSSSSEVSLDPKVFWPVNAFIFLLVIGACVFYCRGGFDFFRSARNESDETYQERLRRREQEAIERRRGTPEQRKRRLLRSFQRCKVQMVSHSTKGLCSTVEPFLTLASVLFRFVSLGGGRK